MPNYQNSVIYKIQHNDNESLCYIGSTCNFKCRKNQHKTVCMNENDKGHNYKLYQMIRENGGWDSFKCVVIEEYPCETKRQLNIREEEYRVNFNANMNSQKAFRDIKEYEKQYRKENKDKIKEYNKQYRMENTDKIKEHMEEYRKENADKIKEQRKEYNKVNVEKIKEHKREIIVCECGCDVKRANLSRHRKTNKHLDIMTK